MPHSTSVLPTVAGRRVGRLLILKPSGMGDVVHALPVASALRRQFPALRISWAIEERFAALVAGHPAVDRVVALPRLDWVAVGAGWPLALRRAVRALREEPYDLALDLQGLAKSALLVLWSGAAARLGAGLQREGAAWVSPPLPVRARGPHAVDEYLAAATFLGAPPGPAEFALPVRPDAVASVAQRLDAGGDRSGRPLIVINPSAARARKAWPLSHWVEVTRALTNAGRVVLVGGAERSRRHAQLAQHAGGAVRDLTGRTSLAELVALLARCDLHLAADTGSLHVAAALGRPLLGIYGPTPVRRLGPYGRAADAVQRADACGPTCPRLCLRRRACLRAVTPAEVVARARAALRRG